MIPHLPDTWITQSCSSNSCRTTSSFIGQSGMCPILQKPTALLAFCCLSLSTDVIELEDCHMNEDLWFGDFLELLKRRLVLWLTKIRWPVASFHAITITKLSSYVNSSSKPSHCLFHRETPCFWDASVREPTTYPLLFCLTFLKRLYSPTTALQHMGYLTKKKKNCSRKERAKTLPVLWVSALPPSSPWVDHLVLLAIKFHQLLYVISPSEQCGLPGI